MIFIKQLIAPLTNLLKKGTDDIGRGSNKTNFDQLMTHFITP